MPSLSRRLTAAVFALSVLAAAAPAWSQEFTPVEAGDLKGAPQKFWAKGFVFRDVLKEAPGERQLKLDDGSVVTGFGVEVLGEIYAEAEVAARIANLPVGEEYLFSGTVSQRGGKLLVFGGRKYVYVIKEVQPARVDASLIPSRLAEFNLDQTDNPYNLVFRSVELLMKDVEKELFAYATAQGIDVKEVFDPKSEHRAKLVSSIHTALRRAEEKSKMPSQEMLVSLVAAMMAMQSGYVEPAKKDFVPEEQPAAVVQPAVLETQEEALPEPTVKQEEWDLSETGKPEEKPAEPAPANLDEVIEEIAPAAEAPEATAEPSAEPVAETPAPATEKAPAE